MTRRCTRCGIEKSLDAFHPRGDRPNALRSACKTCCAATNAAYFQRNRERMQAAAAKWAAAHRGKMCEYSKKWRAKNPDKVRELDKRTPERRARHAILTRERFWANPEKYREMRRSAYAKNPQLRESVYRTNRKRRAQKRGAATGAPIDYGAIAKRAGMKCHLCGKRIRRRDLSFDHLIPLALGGPHVEWNISTAHLSCNASKGARFATPAQLPLL